MPPRKQNNAPTSGQSKPSAQECVKQCPVVGIMLDYFVGKYGNDARPQVIQDLNALKGKE